MRFRPLLLSLAPVLFAAPPSVIPDTQLAFEPNQGQASAEVKFLAHTPQAIVWMKEREIAMGSIRMRFDGAATQVRLDGEERLPGVSNYFAGADRRQWFTNVPHFAKARYRDVYPGIDAVFYGAGVKLEYDFVLRPGANPAEIRLAFDGIETLDNQDGVLVATAKDGAIRNLAPKVFQDGKPISGRWVLRGRASAGFEVDSYDRSRPLTIDPVLTYASFLGGAQNDAATGVAVDAQGNIIVCGTTYSGASFPAKTTLYPNAPNVSATTPVAFVAKFAPTASGGASLVYSTYLGGGGTVAPGSTGDAVAVDQSGNVYVGGSSGDNLPLQNPLPGQNKYKVSVACPGCLHGFVSELSPAGDQLLFSTYMGSSNTDAPTGIAVDKTGAIYFAGWTKGVDYPLAGSYLQGAPYQKASNSFVTVIANQAITFSTYFYGLGAIDTRITGMATDGAGNIYIGGWTNGSDVPTTAGSLRPLEAPVLPNSIFDGWVAALNPSAAQTLVYGTYLEGSSGLNQVNAVAADASGNMYVTGVTNAPDFPVTTGAFAPGPPAHSNPYANNVAFATKINPSAQGSAQLVYSTALGSSNSAAYGIAVDPSGRMLVTGVTGETTYPTTPDAFEPQYGGGTTATTSQSFFSIVDPSKSGTASLAYSTYLGGTTGTYLYGVASDTKGATAAVAGYTTSADAYASPSAFQPTLGGAQDVYVARFDLTHSGPAMTKVENGASLSADPIGALSPGLIFTMKGNGLGPSIGQGGAFDGTGKVSTNVAGVQVLVNNIPCPLLYLSATQINAIVPYEIASQVGKKVPVQIVYNGVPGSLIYMPVQATAPGIFSFDDGSGQGAILNQDSSINGPNNAAARSSVVQIFATGEGQTKPSGVDGAIANEPVGQIPTPVASVSLTIGGVPVAQPLIYAGTLPNGVAGAFQIDAYVPANAPTGSAVPVVLTIGANSSPMTLTMAVK